MQPLLVAHDLVKHFPVRRGLLQQPAGVVRAVDGVSMTLHAGETFALVGESGSGKTTLGLCLIRLLEPTGGQLRFRGRDLLALGPEELRRERRHFQMIFQDPYGSLDPRLSIERTIGEPLEVHRLAKGAERRRRVRELLEMVGLPPSTGTRYPHEFSGGQRQRIGIARALATQPELLVADEPVSALDASVQAQVINLLAELQRQLHLTLVFIGHDLALVEEIADRVAVLYLGRIVEVAPVAALFCFPRHPYTVSLLSAIPVPDPTRRRHRRVLPGEPPSPAAPPPGCRFHTRCPIARDICREEEPRLVEEAAGHRVACHFPGELGVGDQPAARLGEEPS